MPVVIELKNIDKAYGDNVIFKDFNLSVDEGDYLAITGKSGAGKSTLLNMMGLLETQDNGDVLICGKKNPELGTRDGVYLLRNKLGYLFQNYGLVENQTVEYNLKLALKFKKMNKEQNRKIISEVLDRVGLPGISKKKIFQLSGGEQQRIAIAKLMIKSPDIILADEPTGSLDAENRDKVMKLIDEMHKEGKTIVVVTHDEKVKQCAEKNLNL